MIQVKTSNILNKIRIYTVPYHYLRSYVICSILGALVIAEIFFARSFLDEALSLVFIAYILFEFRHIPRYDSITLLLLVFSVFLGLLSNLTSGINVSIFSILVDVIAETKLLSAFFAVKYFVNQEVKNDVLYLLTPISKLFCLSSFFFSVVSLFVDIGMSSLKRYGIGSFKFIFPMSFQYVAVYMVIFAVLISTKRITENARFFYIALSLFSILMNTKGPAIIFSATFVFLYLYLKKFKKINFVVFVLIVLLILLLGGYQINEYLLNENSPRHLFIKYGIKTANDFFPFGSGFSTFGSDQAARNYSVLYYKYGFDTLYGLDPHYGMFLCDTFWPMAIGQFGWIGAILFFSVYIMIFFSIGKQKQFDYKDKAFIYSCFIQYMVHGVGSAILSSSAGMIGFIAMGIFIGSGKMSQSDHIDDSDKKGQQNRRLPNQHIRISF